MPPALTGKGVKAELDLILQKPGPNKFKLLRIDLIYKAKKFKVLPLAF